MTYLLKLSILVACIIISVNGRSRRSIDLIAAHSIISETRLPREVTPDSYHVEIEALPEDSHFRGRVRINVTWQEPTDEITLHAGENLTLTEIMLNDLSQDEDPSKVRSKKTKKIPIKKCTRTSKQPLLVIRLEKSQDRGTQAEIEILFTGTLTNDTADGIFKTSYVDTITQKTKWIVATNFRPNLARKVFPCFDEPSYKVPFKMQLARQVNMTTLSNMPVENVEELNVYRRGKEYWVWDRFPPTPPMATFSLGFAIGEFSLASENINPDQKEINVDDSTVDVRVWSREDFKAAVRNVSEKVHQSLKILGSWWGIDYALPKLDVVALPNYQATRPADSWGILIFKESELTRKCTWHVTQELVYQWLGALATPFWWNDAHINNALVRYLTAYTTLKLDENDTFNNWPMTMLYSIYYEFSKRYPHGKSTAIKQDSASAKTELVFRMLNYTLGEKTFNQGLQKFIADKQYKTFHADDIWEAISAQAKFDNAIADGVIIKDVAFSWISKDRLPVVTVTRDYEANSVKLNQRVYLRERPHDVPDQDKFVWWIPIVMITEDNLNFRNSTPRAWMKREKEIVLADMPSAEHFIIVNPEEIGPFPVNYDLKNWNMLAKYLCGEGRMNIPVNTRAKLLHDAWNLAYAGDLSFATALNMTLFLKHEREYLAWDPVFTLIDHIGRHIDSSEVHKKFQTYVRLLLTPLYEELGNEPQEGEPDGRAHLRSSSKIFLCQAGYKPCIEEAQEAFKKWMENKDPDEGNPVANQYICPVFKWGTKEEWEFGLDRILHFPSSRKPSERTYLLKTLAGCPNDAWKIERLLNITVLEQNGNFTDNDVYLIFSMLTGSASGYTTLFNFLKNNWDALKIRFEGKPHLWNSLVTSATTVFKTQEGLDMVTALYAEKQQEFGTADFVVEKAIKNIQEETKWSNENLPVIENWLNQYLKDNQVDFNSNN